MAGARRAGVVVPPPSRSRGPYRGVRGRDADRGGRGDGGRLRARPDRQVPLFLCDGNPVVALVPGDRRGDAEKVAKAVGAASGRVAKREEVEAATGFPPGAVAPFPLPRVETVLVDRSLLKHALVWAGAGSERHMVGLAPLELARLARARPMDVVQDRTYDANETKER